MKDISNIYISDAHEAIAPRLRDLIENSVSLRMAVAYWTISNNYLSPSLIDLLKRDNSFACIDISIPTKVSEVCELSRRGAPIYFYLKKINEDKGNPDYPVPRISNHLLHSKVLLFDLPDDKAIIWIGSHNWTDRALSGINIETSVELQVEKGSSTYTKIENLLCSIKNNCHRVNPDLEEVYRNIQRKDDSCLYLHSILDVNDLWPQSRFFHFLGLNQSGLIDFPAGRNIVLFLSNTLDDKAGYICKAKVLKSGLLPKIVPSLNWPNLENGYWSLQDNNGAYSKFRDLVYLENKEKERASFYATILLEKEPENIQDIDSELLDYEPAIHIQQELNFIRLRDMRTNYQWLHPKRKHGILFQEPQIDSSKISDYKPSIEPGKVAKVKKRKNTKRENNSQNKR